MLNKIFFLTGNKHKFEEVEPLVYDFGFKIEMLPGHKLEIQSDSLVRIAEYAALNAYMKLEKPILVEDAGLFVEALNGFPGPYSSYVYSKLGFEGILRLLEGVEDRGARFESVSVIVYKPCIITATGKVYGTITEKPYGNRGFGFDPIFKPKNSEKTFAEMDIHEKNKYSHRARSVRKAFQKLSECIKLSRDRESISLKYL